jgi:hypothetical protein
MRAPPFTQLTTQILSGQPVVDPQLRQKKRRINVEGALMCSDCRWRAPRRRWSDLRSLSHPHTLCRHRRGGQHSSHFVSNQ